MIIKRALCTELISIKSHIAAAVVSGFRTIGSEKPRPRGFERMNQTGKPPSNKSEENGDEGNRFITANRVSLLIEFANFVTKIWDVGGLSCNDVIDFPRFSGGAPIS